MAKGSPGQLVPNSNLRISLFWKNADKEFNFFGKPNYEKKKKKKREIQPDFQEIEGKKNGFRILQKTKFKFWVICVIIFRETKPASHLNEDGEKKRKRFEFRNPPTVKLWKIGGEANL